MITRRTFALASVGAVTIMRSPAAVRGDATLYMGGTIAGVEPKTKGRLDLTGSAAAVFAWKKGKIEIPYAKITSLEYGQKAGRRVGVAVAITIFALFSKKRRHFLTVGYDADGKQGAVFELAKGAVRSTLTTFETRSGRKVEYESEDARKNIGG